MFFFVVEKWVCCGCHVINEKEGDSCLSSDCEHRKCRKCERDVEEDEDDDDGSSRDEEDGEGSDMEL